MYIKNYFLFRGKCQVKELDEIKDLADYISNEDNFFFQHGYKPESRCDMLFIDGVC